MLIFSLTACYESHGFGDQDASVDGEVRADAGEAESCPLPELIQSWTGYDVDGQCVLEGASDGSLYEVICDGSACTLIIDGEPTCECAPAAIDFANVCPNGVPTCSDWPIFDWSVGSWDP